MAQHHGTVFFQSYALLAICLTIVAVVGCKNEVSTDEIKQTEHSLPQNVGLYDITFIELGSVGCLPCRKMVKVMDSISANYPDNVNVVFYDVWTPEGRPFADIFQVQSIPTQVLLDNDGKEFYRHEGYLSTEELVIIIDEKLDQNIE